MKTQDKKLVFNWPLGQGMNIISQHQQCSNHSTREEAVKIHTGVSYTEARSFYQGGQEMLWCTFLENHVSCHNDPGKGEMLVLDVNSLLNIDENYLTC